MPTVRQTRPQGPAEFTSISPKRALGGAIILWIMGLLFIAAAILFPLNRINNINSIYDFQSPEIRARSIRKQLPLAIISGLAFGGFGALLIGFGVLTVRHSRKNRDLHVEIKPNGVLRTDGDAAVLIRWDNIETVWETVVLAKVSGVRMPPSYFYTLKCKDGQSYQFDSTIKNVHALGETIQKQVAQKLLPGTLAALERGETLAFGPFNVDREGISKGGKIAWQAIAELDVYRGWLTIRQKTAHGKQNFASVRVQKIPNLGLLLALARQFAPQI